MKFFGQITSITILIAPVFAFAMILGTVILEEARQFFRKEEV